MHSDPSGCCSPCATTRPAVSSSVRCHTWGGAESTSGRLAEACKGGARRVDVRPKPLQTLHISAQEQDTLFEQSAMHRPRSRRSQQIKARTSTCGAAGGIGPEGEAALCPKHFCALAISKRGLESRSTLSWCDRSHALRSSRTG